MAYYRDVSIVDIKDWEPGLQDGITQGTNIIPLEGKDAFENLDGKVFDEIYPFVKTNTGYQRLTSSTDKIVTRLDGTRFVITEKQFAEYYHSDSGMFAPDLDKHAEFEYVVRQFSRMKQKLRKLKKDADNMESIKDAFKIPDKVEEVLDHSEAALYNLKEKADKFTARVKEQCSCKN